MGLFGFGDNTKSQLKKLEKIAAKIEALDEAMQGLTDEQLKQKTEEFKERYQSKKEDLDDLLPEAFAVIREAAWRVLGQKPFHVQLIGGIVLHQGRIAEMKTGEGKTLVATLPAYLNALSGKGVHIVTVNEYLAGRDANWMGQIFKFLGLTVGINGRDLSSEEKKEAYNSDILYSTNNEIGFDYLRDNMVVKKENRVGRKLNYCIIDEVDSVLIDEARTPLIISGGKIDSKDLYTSADRAVKRLNEDDYTVDEKTKSVSLTESGVEKIEKTFRVNNLYDLENTDNRMISSQPTTKFQKYIRGKNNVIINHEPKYPNKEVQERMKYVPQGGNWQDIPLELGQGGGVHSNNYRRLKWDEPSITIKHVSKSMIIHPIFDRTPTIREVARLQSFSDDFEILGTIYNQHQQLANAVPPLLGKAIASSVIKLLSEYEP